MLPPNWAAEVTRDSVAGREDSVGSWKRSCGDFRGEVDALRHERDSLVAERESVGSDTTMAVAGPSSERMAALIEEGEMKRRKMEAALTKT